MRVVQYYLDCLSQASYLIIDETSHRAAVVDPRRDVEQYVEDAAAAGLTIDYVIETHVHADFLSGHLELAEATGAAIVYGAGADLHFPHREVSDGERVTLGEVVLEFRATPGHTLESVSIVAWEHQNDATPYGVFTGDTLFIGDVGRPDLVSGRGMSAIDMARLLYDSLHTKLMTLPDSTRVYPGHGAGSACGKNLSTETVSTIGDQRKTNHALLAHDVEDFVNALIEGQQPAPGYFSHVAGLNAERHPLMHDDHLPRLSLSEAMDLEADGVVVLDVRDAGDFARGHLRGSVNVGLEGRFAEYAAEVIDPEDDLLLVCPEGVEYEARVRLARVGVDSVLGVLVRPEPLFALHPEVVAVASRVTAHQLARALDEISGVMLIDVRRPSERLLGRIEPSLHLPMAHLRSRLLELDPRRPIVVYCAGGYRSSIAASLLRAEGFPDVSDLIGGYQGWMAARRMATY